MKFFSCFIALSCLSVPVFALDFSAKSVAGYPVADSLAIEKFYTERENKFLWIDGNSFSSDAEKIIELIGSSWEHGLNPDNYHYNAIKEILKTGVPTGREVETEILFTDAVIRYGQDISGMRLSPRILKEDNLSWARGIDSYSLLSMLAEKSDPDGFLKMLLPQDETYKKLSAELKSLAEDLTKNPDHETQRLKFTGVIKPGMTHPAISHIRSRLGLDGNSTLYDADLESKIKNFQKQHGLAADGIIGLRSFDAINQTRTQKLVKLIANLERRRWVRRPLPSRYIAVNIPQMELHAIEEGQKSFGMPVIIGRVKRPTMSFVDDIIGVRFNPRWYVPDTIKNEDYLPQLRKNPNALSNHGIKFRVQSENGIKEVSSTEIDWTNMNEAGLKSVQMYQDSGDDNALGLIRVLMPNKYDIYLHDTNAPGLFSKDDRALSSGCVRLSEPRRIANFVLGKNAGWSDAKTKEYIDRQKLVEIPAEQPVPVYIFYYTAWLDDDGKIIITNDVYGADSRLVGILQAAGKIPFNLSRIKTK